MPSSSRPFSSNAPSISTCGPLLEAPSQRRQAQVVDGTIDVEGIRVSVVETLALMLKEQSGDVQPVANTSDTYHDGSEGPSQPFRERIESMDGHRQAVSSTALEDRIDEVTRTFALGALTRSYHPVSLVVECNNDTYPTSNLYDRPGVTVSSHTGRDSTHSYAQHDRGALSARFNSPLRTVNMSPENDVTNFNDIPIHESSSYSSPRPVHLPGVSSVSGRSLPISVESDAGLPSSLEQPLGESTLIENYRRSFPRPQNRSSMETLRTVTSDGARKREQLYARQLEYWGRHHPRGEPYFEGWEALPHDIAKKFAKVQKKAEPTVVKVIEGVRHLKKVCSTMSRRAD